MPGSRVPALAGNRLLFRDGLAVACMTGGEVRWLEELPVEQRWQAEKELKRSRPALSSELSGEESSDDTESGTLRTA